MVCDGNFFRYGKIIKVTPSLLIYKRYGYVYKVYKINNLRWFREIAFLQHAENVLRGVRQFLKKVGICELKSFSFITKKDYTLDGDEIVVMDDEMEYCMLKFPNLDPVVELEEADLEGRVPEFIFLFAFLNKNYVVHRDLKEANMMFHTGIFSKKLFIADFNMATLNGIKNNKFATRSYKDPILYSSQSADERADVWSFGVMLFHVLAKIHISNILTETQMHDAEHLSDLLLDRPEVQALDENNLLVRIMKICLLKYEFRPTFNQLFDMFRHEFPRRLGQILDGVERRSPRIVTIGDPEMKKMMEFLDHFAINTVEKYYFKNLMEYLKSVASVKSEEAWYSVYCAVKTINDMRREEIGNYIVTYVQTRRQIITKHQLVESLKNILVLCDGDVIARMN